ncbi:helix-turn-helix domain-containing protein [Secundilactobacillus muriivasis]
MVSEKRLSAGQFAAIVHIDRHQLDQYDQLGVFTPETRDSNGRRGYSLSQVNQLLMVRSLLSAGVSVQAVKTALTTSYPEVLKAQQQRLTDQLAQLTAAQEQVTKQLTNVETVSRAVTDEATLVTRPPVDVWTTAVPEGEATLTPSLQTHVARILTAQQPATMMIGRMHPKTAITDGDDETVTTLYTPVVAPQQLPTDETQAAGQYLLLYHDRQTPLLTGFERLIKTAEDQHLVLANQFYEEPVQTDLATADVVRLLVAVRGRTA